MPVPADFAALSQLAGPGGLHGTLYFRVAKFSGLWQVFSVCSCVLLDLLLSVYVGI